MIAILRAACGVGALPQGIFVSRNLSSDPETGLGRASAAQIAEAIRDGRGLDGRFLNLWGMPWMYLHRLSADDAEAIASYLKSLPPVHNAIPAPLSYGFAETIAGKLIGGGFPVAPPPVLTYSEGSYANQPSPSPDQIQGWLVAGQWAAALIALAALIRLPSSRRVWLFGALGAAAAGLAFAAGWFVDATPAIGFLPPDQVADGATRHPTSAPCRRRRPQWRNADNIFPDYTLASAWDSMKEQTANILF